MVQDPKTGLFYDRARWYDASTSVFVSMDPAMADRNLYRYCGNDPVILVDPSGLDFIAEGDRYVLEKGWKHTLSYHYSIEYWCGKKFSPLNHTSGYTRAQILAISPGATKKEAVEEEVDLNYEAWGEYKDFFGFTVWDAVPVWIAYIQYVDSATKIMPIFDNSKAVVNQKWKAIMATAHGYKWAEQVGYNGVFKNWPRSLYQPNDWNTNSNTFARYAVRSAGLTFVEMNGCPPRWNRRGPGQTLIRSHQPRPLPSSARDIGLSRMGSVRTTRNRAGSRQWPPLPSMVRPHGLDWLGSARLRHLLWHVGRTRGRSGGRFQLGTMAAIVGSSRVRSR
jgi:hypothetical protein